MDRRGRPWWVGLIVVALVLSGCRGKSRPPSSEVEPAPGPARDAAPEPLPRTGSASLWQLAPAEAACGIVLGEGAGEPLFRGLAEAARVLALDPTTAGWAARLVSWLKVSGIDLADPAARTAAGIDVDGGLALFLDRELAPLVVVLPVADPALLADALGGRPEVTDGGERVYRLPPLAMVCVAVGGRTLCGRDRDAIADAMGSASRPLADRVAELPAALRGDVELVGDLARLPELGPVRERARSVLADTGLVVVSARLRSGTITVRGWLEGVPMAPWGTLLVDPTPLPGMDSRAQAAWSGLRWRFDPVRLGAGLAPQAFGGDLELHRDLFDHLTGDVGIYTSGSSRIGGVIALGVTDPAAVADVVPGLCNALFRPFGRIERLDEHGCRVVLELTQLSGDRLAQVTLAQLSGLPVTLSVRDRLLLFEVGESAEGSITLPLPVTDPGWQLALWARGLDLSAATDPGRATAAADLLAALGCGTDPELAGICGVDQLAEVSAAVRFGSLPGESGSGHEGLHLLVTAVTFAADPAPVYTAYQAAIAAHHGGDGDTYRSAMATLVRTYPDSYAGRQAAAARAPIMGPGLALLLAAGLPAWKDWTEPGSKESNRR